MIDSMITKLLEEANEESDKKGWSACIISSREGRIQHRFSLPPERERELERAREKDRFSLRKKCVFAANIQEGRAAGATRRWP